MVKLTISIPAYNDGETIEGVVAESVAAASAVTNDFEILVINDGSSDDTRERVQRLQQTEPRLRYHEHAKNLGFGPTIGEAYLMPESEWVYFIPGDGQCPAAGVQTLLDHADEGDLLLAYRQERSDTASRRFVSWTYNLMVSLCAGRRVRDVNAAGLLRRSILGEDGLKSVSAFVHAELYLEVLRHHGRVVEITLPHRPREHGVASGNKFWVIVATFRELFRYTLDRRLKIPLWR